MAKSKRSGASVVKCQSGQMPKVVEYQKWSNANWSNAYGHMPKWTLLTRTCKGARLVCCTPIFVYVTFQKRPRNAPETFEMSQKHSRNVPETFQRHNERSQYDTSQNGKFQNEDFKWKISKRKVST